MSPSIKYLSYILVVISVLSCGQSAETYDPLPCKDGTLDSSNIDAPTSDGISTTDTSTTSDSTASDTSGQTDTAGNDPGTIDTTADTSTGNDSGAGDSASADTAGTDNAGTDAAGTDTSGTDAAGTDTSGTDTTGADTSGTDTTNTTDSASPDGSPGDSGSSSDTAPEDIGGIIDDGTVVDVALPPDTNGAPPIQPEVALICNSTLTEIYEFPGNLPPFDATQRGAVVRCSTGFTVSQTTAQAQVITIQGIEVVSGYKEYHLTYRTERAPGVPGLGTARLLVPDSAVAGPRPTIVFAHGTAGVADNCTPSKGLVTGTVENLITWAASGYVVIAPDYAGLGTTGVQGYGNHKDSAHSVIDAARAARAMLEPGSVDDTFVVAGHSQGGGIALNVHGYAADYAAPDLELLGAVSFGGSIQANNSILGFHYPNLVSLLGGNGVRRAVFALALYADWANTGGETVAGEIYHPDVVETILPAVEGNCIYQIVSILAGSVGTYTAPNTLTQIISPTILDGVVDCFDNANCTPTIQAYLDRMLDNQPLMDPDGGALLVISAEDDVQNDPVRQSCVLDFLADNGVDADSCLFADLTHFDMLRGSIGYAIAWVKSLHNNEALPACPSALSYPPCE